MSSTLFEFLADLVLDAVDFMLFKKNDDGEGAPRERPEKPDDPEPKKDPKV